MIDKSQIAKANEKAEADLRADFDALGEHLSRRGVDIDAVKRKVSAYGVAIPSWGVGTGGTRFARFPGSGEPRDIFDKMDHCAVIPQLTGATHTDGATRQQAVKHNIEGIETGKAIGSKALTVWVGDGSNFPGQTNFTSQFERYLDAMKSVYAALPDDWRIFSEHKMYEPAFYSTVVQDWGTNYLIASELGPKAFCLVDLGHHAPNVNIEMIVARLIQFGKLGGFHFNDSKYGDDDLDTGSIDPYRLFLVFNELVDAENRQLAGFDPAHMLDQSHNVTDPIESLMISAMEVQRAYAQALLVDRGALKIHQQDNDALMATTTLKRAFRTDVEPILAMARMEKGAAVDPVAAYRASGYRAKTADERPAVSGAGGGIV